MKIIADMPTPIHYEKENYDEGVIYTYIFNDGVVLFFEGALMQFEPDAYTPQGSVRKINAQYSGEKNMENFGKDMFTAMSDYITTM